MSLRRIQVIVTYSLLFVSVHMALAQQKFQVETIKPSAPNTAKHTQSRGTKFATTGTTVEDLLKFSYNVHVSQIVGGPNWVRTQQFDILADPEMERRPSLDELKLMTAELLSNRFHLVLAREKRELAVFAIVRSKGVFKPKPASSDPSSILSGALVPPGSLYVHGGTVTDFAAYLQRYAPAEINRPVVDRTGIVGRFEFELHFTPEISETGEQGATLPSDSIPPPAIFTALQEQLGLKLISTKAKVEVLNIVSVSLPTPD